MELQFDVCAAKYQLSCTNNDLSVNSVNTLIPFIVSTHYTIQSSNKSNIRILSERPSD